MQAYKDTSEGGGQVLVRVVCAQRFTNVPVGLHGM